MVLRPQLQKTTTHNQIQEREVRRNLHKETGLDHNHNQAPVAVATTLDQHSSQGISGQGDHTSNAQLVVNTTILRKTVVMTTSTPNVVPDRMLHISAMHHSTQVTTLFVYIVAAHSTPWEIAPIGPMTTEKSQGLHQGIFTVHNRQPGFTKNSGNSGRNFWNTQSRNENSGNPGPQGNSWWQRYENNRNNSFPYRDHRYDQNNRNECQHMRFDERYNQQYSPNYNQYSY